MLGFMFPKRTSLIPDDDSEWSGGSRYGSGIKTQAGVRVDENLALTLGYCWRASQILAQGESTLPLNTYLRGANDSRELSTDSPVYELLKTAPNPTMGSMAFREGRTMHMVNNGNGFAEIVKDSRGRLESLWPIHPYRVSPSRPGQRDKANNEIPQGSYLIRNDSGSYVAIHADEMLHLPGCFPEDGIWGKGVVPHARESIGLGLATERAGATQFGVGNVPRVVVSGGGFKNSDARAEFRRSWKTIHGSPDSGEIAIVPADVTVSTLGLTADAAQYLGTREFNGTVIAGWYGVPAHMLGLLKGATFATVEAISIEFVIYSLYPWLRRWEEQCNRKLFSPLEQAQGHYVEHLVAGLLRGDIMTRMNAYRIAIMIGVLTINECRKFENMNSIGPDGDINIVPANMVKLSDMASGNYQLATSGPGSDQHGAPGDKPPGMSRADHADLQRWLTDIESTLRSDHRAAMAPVPRIEDKRGEQRIEAAKLVLSDTLSRMFAKEANAARRVVDSKGDFDAWLVEFYGKHESLLASALVPACGLLAALGGKATAPKLAARLCADGAARLGHGYNTLTPVQFAALLADWPTGRAADEAAAIVREACGGPGSGVPGPCADEGSSGKPEDQHISDRHADEQQEMDDRHDKENEQSPDNEPEAVAAARDDRHSAEQSALADRQKSEQKEHDKLEKGQEKEYSALEKQQGKEEKDLDRSQSKETAALDRQHDKEDAQFERDKDKASKESTEKFDKDRPESETQEEYDKAEEKNGEEFDKEWHPKEEAKDARQGKERDALEEKQVEEWNKMKEQHDRETKELGLRHESQTRQLNKDQIDRRDSKGQRQQEGRQAA